MDDDDFDKKIERVIRNAGNFYKMMWGFSSFNEEDNEEDIDARESSQPEDAVSNVMEVACAALLVRSASDMHRLAPVRLSNTSTAGGPAETVLDFEFLRVAGIGMRRNDIPSPEMKGQALDNFTFKWDSDNQRCVLTVNPNAKDDKLYNQVEWQNERLSAIRACLDAGAHIISLGEFDYPMDGSTELTKRFEDQIIRMIDGIDRPVFLVAGSRHEVFPEGQMGSPYVNAAKIFVNQELADRPNRNLEERPLTYCKRTAARKVGERLSPTEGIELQFYNTCVGSIAVLVCSDAYDPTVVFEIIRQAAISSSHTIEVIVVPAYNHSVKLLYACQALSFLTKSTLLLVDACVEKKEEKDAQIELFVNGVRFDNLIPSAGRRIETAHDKTRGWEISKDFLNESRQRSTRKSTPFFDRVQSTLPLVPRSAGEAPLAEE